MIDVHYWTTPNGHKVTIFLEEAGLEYKIIPVNIGKGEQFKAEFLAVSPNNRIPAIVDGELEVGMRTLAVPVVDSRGRTVAALSVNGAGARLDLSRLRQDFLPVLLDCAVKLGRTQ